MRGRKHSYRLMRWHNSRGCPENYWRIERLTPQARWPGTWLTIEDRVYEDKNIAIDRLEELMRAPQTRRARVWRHLRAVWSGGAERG